MEKKVEQGNCLTAAITYVIMIAANVLAETLRLGGVTTAEISAKYPNLFTPAPTAFAIWAVIYLLLAVYTIYQLDLFHRTRGSGYCATELTGRIAPWYTLSSLANALWVVAWHFDLIIVTVLLMALLVYSLAQIIRMLCGAQLCFKERICVRLPFSVYFAWILVAAIANVTVLLVSLNWNGWGVSREIWTIIALALGAGLGIAGMLYCKNIAFGLVFLWAYAGILKQHASPLGWDLQYPQVVTALLICMLLFVGVIGYLLFEKRKKINPDTTTND